MKDAISKEPGLVVSPGRIAADLRTTVGALVRATRATDRLAPIPSAVLDLLDRHGAMTTAELAVSRGVRHQTMAATVKELTEAGFLAARAHPSDARKKVLTLTPDGKNAIDQDRRYRDGVLAHAVADALDDGEQLLLARALLLINRITGTIADSGLSPSPDRGPVTGAW
ncbi:MarR family transcriptional regulator [Streptomyces sp. NPDC048665]|uniref:MarR family winged helix-turn-helix transcriptional regulator n=1 Tax=Streptomyces sp. NPDC048665 TaxID=3155490 RepID=UPI003428752E